MQNNLRSNTTVVVHQNIHTGIYNNSSTTWYIQYYIHHPIFLHSIYSNEPILLLTWSKQQTATWRTINGRNS